MITVPHTAASLPVSLKPLELGSGRVEAQSDDKGRWCGELRIRSTGDYADAQLDDHRHSPRPGFPHRPPFRLSLRARTSVSQPLGTFGFGLWNDPFSFSLGQGGAARRLPAAPQALWFFYASPPSDIALDPGLPGWGWKASALRSRRVPPLLLAPLAAAGVVVGGVPILRRALFAQAKRFYRAEETLLFEDPRFWHRYEIDWRPDMAEFRVDGRLVLSTSCTPVPPLGLILWIDNQFAAASPSRGFGFGVLDLIAEQWLEIAELEVANQSVQIPSEHG